MSGFDDLAAGTTFAGQFRVVRKLAQGGMGAVYIAEQIATGRERALKLMHPGLVSSRELRDKFTLEARVGAKIKSEHVVEVVAAGVDASSGSPWLAMELLTGEDLSAALKRRGPLTVAETASILAQVCHALAAAHDAGIVHRDLKPENVFLADARRASESFTVKVLDFGIAKVLEAARGSNTGAIGSPLWMAPEQTERNAEITPATDVWALGLVAFAMLTARSFWLAADQPDMALSAFLRELVLDEIPRASDRARELRVDVTLPPGFDEWFSRAITRDRAHRYANAAEAYRAFCEKLGIATVHSGTGPVKMPATSTGPFEPDQARSSDAETDRLASAHTIPQADSDGDARPPRARVHDEVDPEEAGPATVPVQGLSPRLFAIGGVVVTLVVAASAIALIRAKPSAPPAPDAPDAASAMPYCPKGMVRVAAGEVTIGDSHGPSEEQPAHAVKMSAFCIDETEVSVADYRECVAKKGCPDGHTDVDWGGISKEERATWSAFCNISKNNRADHPMNCVSFDDAASYCRFVSKKLPTEEQWEYAARGEGGRAYPWGFDPPSASRVNGCDDGCARVARRTPDTIARRLAGDDHWEATSPTGGFPEGVSASGAFDMAGNVAEWVDAPFCNYGQSACGTAARVVRGGSWMTDLEAALRTTARVKAAPSSRLMDVGFRCVK